MNKSIYDIDTMLAIRQEAEEQRAAYLLSLGRRIADMAVALFGHRKSARPVLNH